MYNNETNEKTLIKVIRQEIAKSAKIFADAAKQPVYTNKEMMKMLDISSKTLKKYRDNGYLGFTQYDDKFFYSSEDLAHFLSASYYPPFATQ